MKPQAIVQVDSFTDKAFAGNPAGVCVLPAPASEAWMQNVAREMNVSQTAFLHRDGDSYRLRWFSPTVEVEICGHATLASAHVLWETGELQPSERARFDTLSGRLTVARADGWIVMDFPALVAAPVDPPAGLSEALGVQPVAVLRNSIVYLVEVATADEVRAVKPDLARIATFPMNGVIVTAEADCPGFDFVSRFFAPRLGINEDPATGSSHCALAPYWTKKLGKNALTGYQASARGGVIRVEVKGDRVLLSGKAVTVLRGELVSSATFA
jgi:PhzF family phenazine biosynthesis protein